MLASEFLSGELLPSIAFFPYENKGNGRLFIPKLYLDTIYSVTAPTTYARSDVRKSTLDFYHFQQFASARIAISSRLHVWPKVLRCIDKNPWKSYFLEKETKIPETLFCPQTQNLKRATTKLPCCKQRWIQNLESTGAISGSQTHDIRLPNVSLYHCTQESFCPLGGTFFIYIL